MRASRSRGSLRTPSVGRPVVAKRKTEGKSVDSRGQLSGQTHNPKGGLPPTQFSSSGRPKSGFLVEVGQEKMFGESPGVVKKAAAIPLAPPEKRVGYSPPRPGLVVVHRKTSKASIGKACALDLVGCKQFEVTDGETAILYVEMTAGATYHVKATNAFPSRCLFTLEIDKYEAGKWVMGPGETITTNTTPAGKYTGQSQGLIIARFDPEDANVDKDRQAREEEWRKANEAKRREMLRLQKEAQARLKKLEDEFSARMKLRRKMKAQAKCLMDETDFENGYRHVLDKCRGREEELDSYTADLQRRLLSARDLAKSLYNLGKEGVGEVEKDFDDERDLDDDERRIGFRLRKQDRQVIQCVLIASDGKMKYISGLTR